LAHLGHGKASALSNQLTWASFPCTKSPFPINNHAGEGFKGAGTEERKEKRRKEKEKKKKKS